MRRTIFGLLIVLLIAPSFTYAQIYDSNDLSLRVTSLAWSPDGILIAASFGDATVKVWKFNMGDIQLASPAITFHPHAVNEIEWTPDGKYLVTQGTTRTEDHLLVATAAKWEYETGILAETLLDYRLDTAFEFDHLVYNAHPVIGFDSTFEQAAYSFNSRMVSLSNRIDVFFVGNQNDPPQSVQEILWSPDDTRLAIVYGTTDTYRIQILDVESGSLINTIWGPDYGVFSMRWNSDGSQLAVSSIWANPFSPSANVRLYTIKAGNDYLAGEDILWNFADASYAAIDWHPRENRLAIASPTGIQIYDPTSQEPIAAVSEEAVVRVDWSPDGKYIAGGLTDGTIHIWNAP